MFERHTAQSRIQTAPSETRDQKMNFATFMPLPNPFGRSDNEVAEYTGEADEGDHGCVVHADTAFHASFATRKPSLPGIGSRL